MKMISSTSTTSTSGVMLISDCGLEPVLTCIVSVSLRLSAGGLRDQPHSVEAGLLDRLHGHPDLAEVEPCVGSDHPPGIRAVAHRGIEALTEALGCDRLVVDPEPAGPVDRDQDLPALVTLIDRLLRVRQVDIRPLAHLRRHHHEDDQQHEHHVDERRDVDGRLHLAGFTESHTPPPEPSPWMTAP